MAYCGRAGSIYWSARTTLWEGGRKPRDTAPKRSGAQTSCSGSKHVRFDLENSLSSNAKCTSRPTLINWKTVAEGWSYTREVTIGLN